MADGHGGMRRPATPAPVSGPGALSKRTDGGPAHPMYVSGLPYGEGQAFMDLQTSAPLGAEAAKPRMSSGTPSNQGGQSPMPLFAPTARPQEPVTAGAPVGPGPGPDPSGTLSGASAQDAQQLKAYLPALQATANMPGAPTSFVRFVAYLRAL